jgi:hypothetical protein
MRSEKTPVGGIGAAGRDCFGVVQTMNICTAHSLGGPLDRSPRPASRPVPGLFSQNQSARISA